MLKRTLFLLMLFTAIFATESFDSLLGSRLAHAQVPIRFARYPALSPNGKQIAFSWKGDIWLSSVKGGQARQLTSHSGYDAFPNWSPDGKLLAFASRRHGNYDVFIMPSQGGKIKRLTFHQSHDQPLYWSKDSQSIFFRSLRSRTIYRRYWSYKVSISGGTPSPAIRLNQAESSRSPSGRYLAFVQGTRRWWKRRHTMPYHRHIWLHDTKTDKFTYITPPKVTADSPSWRNEYQFVYRSEQGSQFNLWSYDLRTKKHTQLTHFKTLRIRFPQTQPNAKIALFSRWDRIYSYHFQTKKISEIKLLGTGALSQSTSLRKVFRKKISEYVVSPNGKEVAFIIQGEVYVRKLKSTFQWARRITQTPWRERDLAWSPDGKQLAFTSDQGGQIGIHIAYRAKKSKLFSEGSRPKVKRFSPVNAKESESLPQWSPNGKHFAFRKGSGEIVLYEQSTKKRRTLLKGWNLESFQWSPDSRWLSFIRMNKDSDDDIHLLRIDRPKKVYNLSRHPDYDSSPQWSANGRMFAYISRGLNDRYQIQYAFLRKKDHQQTKPELQESFQKWARSWKKRKKKSPKSKKKDKIKTKKSPSSQPALKKAPKQKANPKPSKKQLRHRIDLKKLAFRLRSLKGLPDTGNPPQLLISATGQSFYFTISGKQAGIYKINWDGKGLKRLIKGSFSQLSLSSKGKIFFLKRGQLQWISLKKPSRAKTIRFQAEWTAEKKQLQYQKFQEGWLLLKQWFYDPQFHGLDWLQIKNLYATLVKATHTDEDFDDAVRLMLGELNASHLGIYTPYRGTKTSTGDLGVRLRYIKNKGLKIVYVRPQSPAKRKRSRLRKGELIQSIDGHSLKMASNIFKFLRWRNQRNVILHVLSTSGKQRVVTIRPVSWRTTIKQRYAAWVARRRRLVQKWSRGKLAYLHIRSMNLSSLDIFERELFAYAHGKEGLVVDVRNNGGGWTTDLLLTMFRPLAHAYTQWRGSRKGYPSIRKTFFTWYKPVILLCNQRSISNAEIFSHAFKNLKLGAVVGMPTYGGVISTRWKKLMDGTWFGIPLRGWWTLPHKKNMENGPAIPHVQIRHRPKDQRVQRDRQLKEAVKRILQQIQKKKKAQKP